MSVAIAKPHIKFWPVGVTMIKPHPHMFNNDHPVSWKPHAKYQPGWSFDYLLIVKQLPVCGYGQTTPNVVNNAYLSTWRLHVKFRPDLSFNWLLVAEAISCVCGYNRNCTHYHTHILLLTLTRYFETTCHISAFLVQGFAVMARHTHTHLLRIKKLPMVRSTMMAVSWMNPGPTAINLAYDGITQKCWCLVRSCLRNFLPQAQLSVLNSDCLLAEQVFHRLHVEIFSTPSKHR